MSARSRRPGFTLVEVLVSLALFAMAAVVLGAAYVNVLASHQSVRVRQHDRPAIEFVRGLLLAEPDRARAAEGGEMTLSDGELLRWRTSIGETAIADLFVVTIGYEFHSTGEPAPRREAERLQLLRPTWSDPLTREALRASSRERLGRREF